MARRRTGSIQKRGDSFRIRYRDAHGIRHEETIIGTRADAESELAIRMGGVAQGLPYTARAAKIRFEELAADVVNDYRARGLKSVADIEARFRLHINPRIGQMKAMDITTATLRKRYILSRKKDTPKPSAGSINRELEAIRRAFCLAVEGKKLPRKRSVVRAEPDIKRHSP